MTADIIELARQYGRYGYRKIWALLRQAGWLVNDKRVEQPLFVVAALRRLALRRAVLPERRTGATLGDANNATDMLDTGTATRRAQ